MYVRLFVILTICKVWLDCLSSQKLRYNCNSVESRVLSPSLITMKTKTSKTRLMAYRYRGRTNWVK